MGAWDWLVANNACGLERPGCEISNNNLLVAMHCRHIKSASVGGTNTGRGPTAIKVRPLGNTRLRQTNELPEVRGFVSVQLVLRKCRPAHFFHGID